MHRTLKPSGILFIGLASLLLAFPAFAGETGSSEPQVETTAASAPAEVLETLPAEATLPIVEVQSSEEAPNTRVGRTWQFYSRESCYDMFGQSCFQSYFPAPFCPPNPAGKSCSGSPYRCFVIISSHWADEYLCQP